MTSSISSGTTNVPTLTPIVDAALTEVTGSVVGGGAPGKSGPVTSIPPFVQQYLDADPAKVPSAVGGVVEQQRRDNEAPSKKGGATTGAGQAREGQATNCFPQGSERGRDSDNDAPSKKHRGGHRYRHLSFPLPPVKGGPVPPTAPPTKGEPPMKVPPMKAPPMSTPPMKVPPMKVPPMKTPPTGVEGPPPVKPAPAPTRTYTTVRGDNLSQIAEKLDVSWQQLYWANRDQIQNPDLIYAGQTLTVPSKDLQVPGFTYTPLFQPGIRSETAGTGVITSSTPPTKVPDAPTPDAPAKVDPAPPKDAKTVPTPDAPGTPPPASTGPMTPPPPPTASANGLPPALP